MGRGLWVVSTAFLLGGCVSAPPTYTPIESSKYQLAASSVQIADYTDRYEYEWGDGVFSNDYTPMPDRVTSPPVNQLVTQGLKQRLEPGVPDGDALTVSLLNARVLYKARAFDSVPFLGVATAFQDKMYGCVIEADVLMGGNSRKLKTEVTTDKIGMWDMDDPSQEYGMMDDCMDKAAQQISDYSFILNRKGES